jgi:hypothetical protein
MKNALSRDVTPCGFYKNRRFEGTYVSIFRVIIGEMEKLAVTSS